MQVHGDFRHTQVAGRVIHAFAIFVIAEQVNFAVSVNESFGPFKDGLAVVQAHGAGHEGNRAVRNNAGVLPLTVFIIDQQHVVGA